MENQNQNVNECQTIRTPICQDCKNWQKLTDCQQKPFNQPACQFFVKKSGRPANPNKARARMPITAPSAPMATAPSAPMATAPSAPMATFNRDNYLVKSNPDFVWTDANKATFEDMELFLKMGKFFYLESHAGNGKNELIKKLAEKYNRPLVLISCAGDMGTSSLLGRITALPDGTLGWQDGLVAEAMINGCILVLDEINALDSTVTFAMHNLPDGYINIANNNRMIKAHPDFFLIGTCNPMGYEGVKAMNEAWQGRLACVKMRYDSEVDKMIMDRCPKMPVEVKTGMLAMINMIRDNTDNGQISKPFGHRTTSQIVDYVNGGIGLMKAWDYAYLNKLSDYDCAKVKRIMQDFTSIMEFANGETAKVNDARI